MHTSIYFSRNSPLRTVPVTFSRLTFHVTPPPPISEGGETLSQAVSYYSPGTFILSVAAQKRGGSVLLSRQATVHVTQAARVLEAHCPPVEEPGTPYFCGAVVTGTDAEVSGGGGGRVYVARSLKTQPQGRGSNRGRDKGGTDGTGNNDLLIPFTNFAFTLWHSHTEF